MWRFEEERKVFDTGTHDPLAGPLLEFPEGWCLRGCMEALRCGVWQGGTLLGMDPRTGREPQPQRK